MKFTKCIDCNAQLTSRNLSLHQKFRCKECFKAFAQGVEGVLTGKQSSARHKVRPGEQ